MNIDTTGMNMRDLIDAYFCLVYFNLQTGDYDEKFCLEQIVILEGIEEYEACEGIKKAINFLKYGNNTL